MCEDDVRAPMSETGISEEFADQIVRTCRTAIGDALQAVIYFTPEEFDMLYVRSDLYRGDKAEARKIKAEFVHSEQLGFDDREVYNRLSKEPGTEPEIGEYEFTIRVFSDGFASRVLSGGHGVLLTTDGLEMDAFEELAIAIRNLLRENP